MAILVTGLSSEIVRNVGYHTPGFAGLYPFDY